MHKEKENTKFIIENYRYLKKYVENLEKQIKLYELSKRRVYPSDGISGIAYDGIPTSKTYNISSLVENMIVKSIREFEQFKEELEEKKIILEIIENAVDGLKENYRRLIKLYYMNDEELAWIQVADILGTAESHCKQYLHNKALQKLNMSLKGIKIQYKEVV